MSESIQHTLQRIRPPRVRITYDVEIGNAIEKKEIPFILGVLIDLYGSQKEKTEVRDRKFIEIDRENFNEVLNSFGAFLQFSVNNTITGEGTIGINLKVESIDSLHPSQILRNVPELNSLYQSRVNIVDLMSKLDGNFKLDVELIKAMSSKKIDNQVEVIEKSGMGISDEDKEKCKVLLTEFESFLSKETESLNYTNTYSYLTNLIKKIDDKLSRQMDEILHNPAFSKFEGSVRGLYYLISNTNTGSNLKIKILNISKDEIFDDFDKAVDFDQSQLFKKVYEYEYGTFGGKPYSCLVGDYEFGPNQTDIEILRKLSGVAASSHAPFMTAASAKLFGMESFTQMGNPRDLRKIFESSEFFKWNGFRETEDSRYLSLLLPRVLIRNVYGDDFTKVKEFSYEENPLSENNEFFCWTNPAFFLAQRITNAFDLYSWTAAIRGVEGGGIIENLPIYRYRTKDGDIAVKSPTEVLITDRREKELSDLGFISVVYKKDSDIAVFFGCQTSQKPKEYMEEDANANSMLSSRLTYILNASRFAHYIKIMMRDKIGSFMSGTEIQSYLQSWMANYILLSDEASQESKSRFPLREGKVNIVADESNPGEYKAVIFLRPHFQLEGMTVSLRLVAKIPAQKG
jgi:type VI secretion system protein ImpC